MSSLNKVQLMGRLGADPEIKRLNSGDLCVNLRLATSETWKDKNSGERKERTEWHTVVIFNQHIAKIAEQYLKKGNLVFVEGMLGTRKWQDQSGQDRYSTEVVLKAYNGELILMPNGERRASGPDEYGQQSSRSDQRRPEQSPGMRELDDEIPF